MKDLSQVGFTLIEMLVVIICIGILVVVAIPSYQIYAVKAQVNEAFTTTNSHLISTNQNMLLKKCTEKPGTVDTYSGRYGKLSIYGNYQESIPDTESCETGCRMTFTFTGKNVKQELLNKKIEFNILSGPQVVKDIKTTVDQKFLPTSFHLANQQSQSESCKKY